MYTNLNCHHERSFSLPGHKVSPSTFGGDDRSLVGRIGARQLKSDRAIHIFISKSSHVNAQNNNGNAYTITLNFGNNHKLRNL